MAADIIAIDTSKEANTITMVCSTTPTGFSAKKITVDNAPQDQEIENIQYKYDDKFDDPTYYFDDPNSGGTIDGDVLGV